MIIGEAAGAVASIGHKFRKRMVMHALVLGAGVVGVTTAYYLSQHGWRVTVVDRAHNVADEASYANGGQLSVYGRARPAVVSREDSGTVPRP